VNLMSRPMIFGILAMAVIVVSSNILVQFLFGNWLTWGAFTYPLAFLVTDVMNRLYGASGLAFLTAQLLDVAVFNRLREGNWWKAPLASSVIGAGVDTALFFSIAFSGALSFIAPSVDVSWAAEVLPILGVGPMAPLWVSLAVADFGVKLALALVALVRYSKQLKGGDPVSHVKLVSEAGAKQEDQV